MLPAIPDLTVTGPPAGRYIGKVEADMPNLPSKVSDWVAEGLIDEQQARALF